MAEPKTTSASPTPRWVTTTRPFEGRGNPASRASPMVAGRVGIALEQAGRPVGQELVTVIDQEEGGIARHVGGAVRGVVHWHDEGIGCQPVAGHDLADRAERRRGDHDVRTVHRRPRIRGRPRLPDPGCHRGLGAEVAGTFWVPIEDRELDARQRVPEDGEMAAALDAGADEPGAWRTAVDSRREAVDRDARHRGRPEGGDRPAVEDGGRHARGRVIEHDDRMDRRHSGVAVARVAGHPFHAEQVVTSIRIGTAQEGRHGVDERSLRTRMDARSWAAAPHRSRARSGFARRAPAARRGRASPP